MRPPVEPSGVGTPDLGWQQSGRRGRAAAARTSTTPAETLAGTQASPRHGSRTVVSTSSAQSGLPTQQVQYDSYDNQLQEQMTALAAQIAALTAAMTAGQRASAAETAAMMTAAMMAGQAAMMAGQRASAAEVRTPSPRPSPPWTAATPPAAPAAPPAPPTPAPPPPPTPAAPPPPTLWTAAMPPAAPAAPPAPPTPAPPPPPTPADPPPPTPAAQPTPTPPGAAPLHELNGPDFCDATAAERRWLAIEPLAIAKELKVNLDPVTMDTDLQALINLLRTHDTNMPFYLDISPEVHTTLLAKGGALAEWLQATDLEVASGVHASLDKDSDNVKNFYGKYSADRALCGSGRALLAHFKDKLNVVTGLAQTERALRDIIPFTAGMPSREGIGLLQAQLQLLLEKLPDSQLDKMEFIRKARQDESQGVMPWSCKNAMLESVAIWHAPSHELSLARAAPMALEANG